MASVRNFKDHRLNYPELVSGELNPRLISSTAAFGDHVQVGNVAGIEDSAWIGQSCIIEDDVKIGRSVVLGNRSILRRGVILSREVSIDPRAYFAEGAGVAENPQNGGVWHTYMRRIDSDVVVGADVLLPFEVQLGPRAIIPVQSSILQLGRFGQFDRMVTVYGGAEGEPFISVGCQFGITMDYFRERVGEARGTNSSSAASYQARMPEIEEAARTVQRAYDKATGYRQQLLGERDECCARLR